MRYLDQSLKFFLPTVTLSHLFRGIRVVSLQCELTEINPTAHTSLKKKMTPAASVGVIIKPKRSLRESKRLILSRQVSDNALIAATIVKIINLQGQE